MTYNVVILKARDMSTRVLSDTLLKSLRIRVQQAIVSLSLNISLICFASSRSYAPLSPRAGGT